MVPCSQVYIQTCSLYKIPAMELLRNQFESGYLLVALHHIISKYSLEIVLIRSEVFKVGMKVGGKSKSK